MDILSCLVILAIIVGIFTIPVPKWYIKWEKKICERIRTTGKIF